MRGLLSIALVAACTASPTRVHLVIHGDAAWSVDQYQVAVGDRTRTVNAYPDLELVLPDDMAGHEQAVDVSALATGAQVAFGSVSVTPRLHAQIDAEVTLAGTTCNQSCEIGTTLCAGAGTAQCVRLDSGCPGVGDVTPCPSSAPFCMAGACVASCDEATCAMPPPTTCASAHVRRTYRGPGTCGTNGCEFAHDDVTCPDGCLAGACVSVSAEFEHACALEPNGSIVCWGNSEVNQNDPPTGTFVQVAAGSGHGCALRVDGTIACWGSNLYGRAAPPSGTFTALSGRGDFGCALRPTGAIACWGDNTASSATPPSGTYTQVSTALLSSCALRSDGTVHCWGDNGYGQNSAPSGTFVAVGAGDYLSVALDTHDHAVTWGADECADPDYCVPKPSIAFAMISSGGAHKCGITTTGTLACFGNNEWGEAAPPSGTFATVSAGNAFSCGLTTGGAIRCWGEDNWGQATPP